MQSYHITEKYCPVVGHNIVLDSSQGENNAKCCHNYDKCVKERGECRNSLYFNQNENKGG